LALVALVVLIPTTKAALEIIPYLARLLPLAVVVVEMEEAAPAQDWLVARAAAAVPLERQKPVVLAIRQAPPRLKATMAVAQIHRAATMVAQAVAALVPLVGIRQP